MVGETRKILEFKKVGSSGDEKGQGGLGGQGSPDETSFIAKHESESGIFTQHPALSTFNSDKGDN
jgi:hypothetical protein